MKCIRSPIHLSLFVVPLLLATAGAGASASAQSGTNGVVAGVVQGADGEPLEGALVSVPRLHLSSLTDVQGRFELSLRSGVHTLFISRIGFAPLTEDVTVGAQASLRLTFLLDESPIELPPFVVTATARTTASPLTTPADIDVLAGHEKEVEQAASLGASLDGLPGVTNISTGAVAGKPVIRGLSGNRVRVLNHGIGMDYQQYGARHSPPVDLHLVERVEVVRGAASILYGSDALGGAVNLIPVAIPNGSDRVSCPSGHLAAGFDSNNHQASGALRLEGAVGGLGWTAMVARRSAGNMRVPMAPTASETGVGTDPRFTGELPHTDFDQTTGSVAVGYRWGPNLVTADYVRWRDERNFLLPNGEGIGQGLSDDALQLRGSFFVGDAWVLRPVVAFQKNLRLANRPGSPRTRLPDDIAVDLLVRGVTLRLEAEHEDVRGLSGRMGVEYLLQDRDTRGAEPLHPAARVDNVSVFAFEGVRWGDLSLEIGARFDGRRQEAEPNAALRLPDYSEGEGPDDLAQSYLAFSGALGLSYRVGPNLAVTANAGRGFRAPSVFELHVYGVHGGVAAFQIGDPRLEAESSLNTDVSVRWHSPRLHVKVTGYRNAIDDYVYLENTGELDPTSGLPIHRTVQEDAVLWGGDISVDAQVLPWLQVRGVAEAVEGSTQHTDLTLPLLPALQSRVGLAWTAGSIGPASDVRIDLTVRRAERQDAAGPYEPFWQYDQNPEFGVASTSSYTLLDAGLSLSMPTHGRPATVHVRATNLTNRAYRDFLDTYKGYALSVGRNLTIRVGVPIGGR